jgi:DNA polymerase III subunit beta
MYKTLERLAKTNRNSGIPILRTLMSNGEKITATDLDLWISAPTDLEVGTYYAEGFSKGVSIDADMSVVDFPLWNEPKKKIGSIELNKKHMKLLEWVALAQSTEITRYYLNGICFEKNNIVATDGHRLHGIEFEKSFMKPKQKVIFPSVCWKYLLMLCKEIKCFDVAIDFYDNNVFCAKVGGYILNGKLIDGTFPQWQRVIPKHDRKKKTFFDADEFQEIHERIDIIKKIHGIKTPAIVIEGNTVKPSNYVFDGAKNLAWTVESNVGDVRIGLNSKYAAMLCTGEMQYGSEGEPIIVRDNRRSIKKFSVLMPLRI